MWWIRGYREDFITMSVLTKVEVHVCVFVTVCVCVRMRLNVNADMCGRPLDKYSVVQREILMLRSAGSCVTDSNTNTEPPLTLMQRLNVSVHHNKLYHSLQMLLRAWTWTSYAWWFVCLCFKWFQMESLLVFGLLDNRHPPASKIMDRLTNNWHDHLLQP